MSTGTLAPLVALMLSLVPPDWVAMRVIYRYDDALAMANIKTYAMTEKSNRQWTQVSNASFEMMDFFDAYRETTHATTEKPWTSMSVTIHRDKPEPVVDFGYGPPDILPAPRPQTE